MTLFIDWQPAVEAFHVGSLSVRWYSLCWAIGLIGAYLIVRHLYADQGIDPVTDRHGKKQGTGKFDPLIFYCFVGVILGARLGHCLFYEPHYFLGSWKGVVEMFLPIRFAADSWDWHLTGYAGLASHGGAIGLLLGLLLYVRRYKVHLLTLLDMMGICAPFTSFCIRMGNLMNSEIIGRPTDLPWAFVFHTREAMTDGQLVPRHPSQLYEALAYLAIFIAAWVIYKRETHRDTTVQLRQASSDLYAGTTKVGTGFYFGFCLATIFTFRFLVEFLKEVQGGVDDGTTALDMGQMLSIPFILVGFYFMAFMPGKKP